MKRHLLVYCVVLLSGCDMTESIKHMGDYMPTIGDRCESMECITPSGKAESDAIKARRAQAQQAAQQASQRPAPQPAAAPQGNKQPSPYGSGVDEDPFDNYSPKPF